MHMRSIVTALPCEDWLSRSYAAMDYLPVALEDLHVTVWIAPAAGREAIVATDAQQRPANPATALLALCYYLQSLNRETSAVYRPDLARAGLQREFDAGARIDGALLGREAFEREAYLLDRHRAIGPVSVTLAAYLIGMTGREALPLLRALLDAGLPVDHRSQGLTLLHWAVLSHQPELVAFLLERGAKPGLLASKNNALCRFPYNALRDCRTAIEMLGDAKAPAAQQIAALLHAHGSRREMQAMLARHLRTKRLRSFQSVC